MGHQTGAMIIMPASVKNIKKTFFYKQLGFYLARPQKIV